jgi:NADH-quinone oxidoreductase subunit L
MMHAFFKAALFLAAGSVIHALSGEQDMDRMGGLWKKMPWTGAAFLAAVLAISGFPGFSGYFSKEAILGASLALGQPIMWAVGAFTAGLTAFYMGRVFVLTFLGKPRDEALYEHAHEAPRSMTIPVVILGFLSVVGGLIGGWLVGWLRPTFTAYAGGAHFNVTSGPLWGTVVGVSLGILGLLAAWWLYGVRRVSSRAGNEAGIGLLGYQGWGMDQLWAWVTVEPLKATGNLLTWADRGFVGVLTAVAQGMYDWAVDLRPVQTGQVRRYALSVLVGTVAVLAYLLVRVR